ncbi:hypothetical protein E8E01_13080 [Methylorubrum populi]|uniref:hypothetical protein n=1 Tax=Methylorubrum populi TaxID=223967 RepID=UPI00114E826E|nr:hypothetical protein [Methylorubrum populi]QDI81303.1 hypothetical protein E8E01_13080 [Methylorubrum populi]
MRQRDSLHPDVAAVKGLLARAAIDLEALRLERTLRRKFSPDQPRAPAGQPDGGQWIPSGGGESGSSESDVASREQTILDDGTRVLSLRIRSGRRDYERQDIVTAPDGQSRIFETSGLTQTIRDGETGAVLGRSTFTSTGAEPEAFAQPAFAPPAVTAGAAIVEFALGLYTFYAQRSDPYNRTVLGLSAQEFVLNPQNAANPAIWVGPVTQTMLDAACKRNGQVEKITNQVTRRVRASGRYRTAQDLANRVHFEIHQIVKGMYDPNFKSEISFDAAQNSTRYGAPGSVRLDLLERSVPGTTCIYDYKTGNSKLTLRRARTLATMANMYFPGTVRIIVTQVKPR